MILYAIKDLEKNTLNTVVISVNDWKKVKTIEGTKKNYRLRSRLGNPG